MFESKEHAGFREGFTIIDHLHTSEHLLKILWTITCENAIIDPR